MKRLSSISIMLTLLLSLFSCEEPVVPVSSIILNSETLSLIEGETSRLTATVSPSNATDKSVVWSSSDATIANVTDGLVSAIKAGTATITVTSISGGAKAACIVTVKARVISVDSISLDQSEVNMIEGDTLTLKATVLPENATEKTVAWSSSDADVAKVVNGTINALKEGSTIISAKAGDAIATCSVTVQKKYIPVERIELDKNKITLLEGESDIIKATVFPTDATNTTISWSSSDSEIATVENGQINALKEGMSTITAMVEEITAICTVTVNRDTTNNAIVFSDQLAKKACVEKFDIDGDGELSYKEASYVKSIDGLFDNYKSVKSFDEFQFFTSVTSIPHKAFARMTVLSSITLPESITYIGNYAFAECAKLYSFSLPKSVTDIGIRSFEKCYSLTTFTIPKGSELYSLGGQGSYDIDGRDGVYCGTFAYCSSLKHFIIPASVKSLGYRTFYNCTSLTDIEFEQGSTISSIPGYAWNNVGGTFSDCTGLENIILPETIQSIGFGAFQNCTSLKHINLPNNISSIASRAFYNCQSLEGSFSFTDCSSIGDSAFMYCYKIRSIILPENCTTVGNSAFCACHSLQSIVLSNAQTTIEMGTFADCFSLKSFKFPENITFIRQGAFAGCKSLLSITIPDSVIILEGWAFLGCSDLTSVTLSNNITEIGEFTFKDCINLLSIAIPDSVESIGKLAFDNCIKLNSVVLSNSLRSISEGAFQKCTDLASIVIPNSVITIDSGAFSACYGAKSLVLGNSIKSIGDYAFGSCSGLTSVSIPSSVTSIGINPFGGCDNISSIIVEEGNHTYDSRDNSNAIIKTESNYMIAGCANTIIPSSVSSIGINAFYACHSLLSINIPESVTSIEQRAFFDCDGLNNIVLPRYILSVGERSFSNCDKLTSVIIYSAEPPQGSPDMFVFSPIQKIFVPAGALEAYKTAMYWSNYSGKFSAIE